MSTDLPTVASERKLQLETVLPDWCALDWRHLIVCVFFCCSFVLFSYLPVSGQRTWSDVCAGQYSTRGEIASILPLSDGIRHQVLGANGKKLVANLFGRCGANGLSIAFAFLQTTVLVLWGIVFSKIRPGWPAFVCVVWTFVVSFFQFDGLNTMMLGHFCSAILLLVLVVSSNGSGQSFSWTEGKSVHWIIVFLLFAFWVNVDATFVLGLIILAVFAVARAVELQQKSGILKFEFLGDAEFQNRVWLFEWAAIATLFNPDGLSLWRSLFWWPDNPLLQTFQTNHASYMISWTGFAVAFGWTAVYFGSRKSNSLSAFLTITAAIMTILAAFSSKMVFWFAVTTAMVWLNATKNVHNNHVEVIPPESKDSLRFVYTLTCGLMIWITFCLTPTGNVLLGGKSRTESQIIGSELPISARQFLNESHPSELYISPVYWAHWIQSKTPIALMCSSDINKVPAMVFRDCDAIYRGVSDWRKIADKYAIAGIVVDKKRNRKLIRHLRRQPGEWQIAFEDESAMVYRREL